MRFFSVIAFALLLMPLAFAEIDAPDTPEAPDDPDIFPCPISSSGDPCRGQCTAGQSCVCDERTGRWVCVGSILCTCPSYCDTTCALQSCSTECSIMEQSYQCDTTGAGPVCPLIPVGSPSIVTNCPLQKCRELISVDGQTYAECRGPCGCGSSDPSCDDVYPGQGNCDENCQDTSACTNGQMRCNPDDETELQVCDSGSWVLREACGTCTVCDSERLSCEYVPDGDPDPADRCAGAIYCSNNDCSITRELERCDGSGSCLVDVTDCIADQSCSGSPAYNCVERHENEVVDGCKNGEDDDCDTLIDCADDDCDSDPDCVVLEICDNGIDDDGDGFIDCKCSPVLLCDPDCPCTEICGNGLDDDCDGDTDCDDSECSALPACQAPSGADLIVEKPSILKPHISGTKAKTLVTVKNNGDQTSQEYHLYLDVTRDGTQVFTKSLLPEKIAGGSMKEEEFDWTPTIAGTYKVNATITDGSNQLDVETTEIIVTERGIGKQGPEYPFMALVAILIIIPAIAYYLRKNTPRKDIKE